MQGRGVYQERLEGATAVAHSVDVSEWGSGVYLAWVQVEGEMPIVRRFLVER